MAADSNQAARQLVAWASLGVCAVMAWLCLLAFVGSVLAPATRMQGIRGLAGLVAFALAAKISIERGGLLELARLARANAGRSALGPWMCFLAHFRLGLASLGGALSLGFVLRSLTLMWWLEPFAWASAGSSLLLFRSPQESIGGHLIANVGTLPLLSLPFFANDGWRLLLPLADRGASKLRVPFVVVTSAVAFATLWWLRSYAQPFVLSLWSADVEI